jgi:hypothetical protein
VQDQRAADVAARAAVLGPARVDTPQRDRADPVGGDEFAGLWDRHEVAVRRQSRPRVQHPAMGLLELDGETLLPPAEDQRLVLLTAPPGSPTAGRRELSRVVGQQTFAGGEDR